MICNIQFYVTEKNLELKQKLSDFLKKKSEENEGDVYNEPDKYHTESTDPDILNEVAGKFPSDKIGFVLISEQEPEEVPEGLLGDCDDYGCCNENFYGALYGVIDEDFDLYNCDYDYKPELTIDPPEDINEALNQWKKELEEDVKKELEEDGKTDSKCVAEISGEKKLSVEMVKVEGGTLTLGSDDEDDNPEHDVTLDDFYMAKYEVTQQLYEDVMEENPSEFKGPKRPVEKVSWYDAVEFCNELSKNDGLNPCYKIDKGHKDPDNENECDNVKWTVKCDWTANGYRLPTEAEWEYAAKGGQKSKETEYAGSDDIDEVAWYENNSDQQTHSVGKKKPNELEIYDMTGNVEEWCWDWDDNGDYLEDGMDNPRGPVSGFHRCHRGSSWCDYSSFCVIAFRHYDNADFRNMSLGFRVCRSAK